MAARYSRYLFARGNVFKPGPEAVVKLVARLRKDGWLPEPTAADLAALRYVGPRAALAARTGAWAAHTVERAGDETDEELAMLGVEPLPAALTTDWLSHPDREELRIVWPIAGDSPKVRYPLTRRPEGPADYALELHRASDYVVPTAPGIGPLPSVCVCSEDLSFQWDEDELAGAFPESTGIFAECEACSRVFDPNKGAGRVTNPFAHHKEHHPGGAAYRFALRVDCGERFVPDPELAFEPELVAALEDEFGRAFVQVGTLR